MIVRAYFVSVLLIETKFGSRKFVPSEPSVVDFSSAIALPTRPLTLKFVPRATGFTLNSVCELTLRVTSSLTSIMPFWLTAIALSGCRTARS